MAIIHGYEGVSNSCEKKSPKSGSEFQSDADDNSDHLTKCFDDYLADYPDIPKYINEFQVKLNKAQFNTWNSAYPTSSQPSMVGSNYLSPSPCEPATSGQDSTRPSIIVFKKKKLKNYNGDNIYEHNLSNPDIDNKDNSKSKVSCLRCRKFKKKCSRSLPECSNCASSDELCVFLPRKLKTRKSKSPSPIHDSLPHLPTPNHANNMGKGSSMTKTSSLPFPLPSIDSALYPQTPQAPFSPTYNTKNDCLATFQNKRLSLPNLHSVIQTAEASNISSSRNLPVHFNTVGTPPTSLGVAPNYSYSELESNEQQGLQQQQDEQNENKKIKNPRLDSGAKTASNYSSKHSNDFDKILN